MSQYHTLRVFLDIHNHFVNEYCVVNNEKKKLNCEQKYCSDWKYYLQERQKQQIYMIDGYRHTT